MKILHGIDFVVQALLIGGVLLVGISSLFSGEYSMTGAMSVYVALLLGPWQMISSLITNISKSHLLKFRRIHFIAAVIYIIGASISVSLSKSIETGSFLSSVGVFLAFAIPVVLALFYFYVTFKTFQNSRTS